MLDWFDVWHNQYPDTESYNKVQEPLTTLEKDFIEAYEKNQINDNSVTYLQNGFNFTKYGA